MAFHPDITRRDDVSLALDAANSAVRIASRQLTGNAGTVEIPNVDGTSTIMGVGAGGSGIAPWVGDTTAPGTPTGITAQSGSGMIVVSWDGTLDGGIPADFSHVALLVDGVESGRLSAKGSVVFGPYDVGATHVVSAVAYDDAHGEDGASLPNASEASGGISVTVSGSDIDPSKFGITITKSVDAASADTPGSNKGDQWRQYDKDPGAQDAALIAQWWWDGTQWVALPIAMYLDQLAARDIQADSAVIGLLSAGIITSGLFKTSGSSEYTIINDAGLTVYKNGKPYSHMGSDTSYGLQLWNPYTSSMVEASSMIFGITPFISADQKNIVPPGNDANFSAWTFEDLPNTFTAPSPRAFGIFSYATALDDDVCAVNCAAILRYNGSDVYAWNSNPQGYVALNGNTITYMFTDLVVGRTYNVRFQWRGARQVTGDRKSNVATKNRSLVLFPS